MLKQGLTTKLGQSLSMTPQMQQAIRLLQLSSLELEQEIQDTLDSNPLLEVDSPENDELYQVQEKNNEQDNSDRAEESAKKEQNDTDTNNNESVEIPSELDIDADWNDVFDTGYESQASISRSEESTTTILENKSHISESLQDHLNWQIHLSHLSPADKLIAETIINAINTDGFLIEDIDDLYIQIKNQDIIPELELNEVLSVLNYVQRLDPIGIAARNLPECLGIQLQHYHPSDALIQKAAKLFITQPALLEPKNHPKLKQQLSINNKEFESLLKQLKTLDPRPGASFNTDDIEYISPDVYVKKINDEWQVSLSANMNKPLKVNEHYANLLTEKGQKSDLKYLKENLKQANWFIHSLENRNQTILKVSKAIMEQQTAFLQYGDQAMKPMILRDIAEKLEMHESSISRATTRKYVHTPQGIFELKHFFSSQLTTETGNSCSSTAIQAMIRKFIDNENCRKPLSDNKLTTLLQEQGIKVARRTVTKYREGLHIPSSHERKVIA
jgi:RNA polymerase sigma-54 factor